MEKIRKIKQYYLTHKFIINLFFLSALFFLHCFFPVISYIVFPILAILLICDNLKNGFSYLVYSLPFSYLNVYTSSLLLIACFLIYVVKFFILKFKKITKPSLLLLIFSIIFLVYCLLPIGGYNFNHVLRLLIFVAVFVLMSMFIIGGEDLQFHFNIRILGLAILVSSVFSLTYFVSPYLQNYLVIYYANGNKLPRFMALFDQTNVLAMFCAGLVAVLAYYIISKKSSKLDIVLFISVACLGIFTFSKTYILLLAFVLLVMLIWRLCVDFKRTAIIFGVLLLVGIIVLLIFPQVYQNLLSVYIRSIGNSSSFADFMNMVTTNRYDLWVEYLNYIFTHPIVLLFGAGLGAPTLSTLSPHCGYIAMVYEFGIFGSILLIVTLSLLLKELIKKSSKPHWSIFVPICTLAFMLMVEDLIFFIF